MTDMWVKGCGTGAEGIECRRLVLQFAIQTILRKSSGGLFGPPLPDLAVDSDSAAYKRLRELWNKHWPAEGIVRYTADITDRDAVPATILKSEDDPLTVRPPLLIVKASDVTPADFEPDGPIRDDSKPTPNKLIFEVALSRRAPDLPDILELTLVDLSDDFICIEPWILKNKSDLASALRRRRPNLVFTDHIAMHKAVLAGMAAGVLPEHLIAGDLRAGTLRVIMQNARDLRVGLDIAYRKSRPLRLVEMEFFSFAKLYYGL